jgi:MFS transporter, FSR family, fosmidomycin resistance protein
VLGLLLISGLASAAFHAPAVALVGDFGGPRLGFAMALFNAGGKLSRTVGPLIIAAAISWFTLEGSAVVMVFGILASIILYLTIDTTESDARSRAVKREPILPLLRRRKRPLIGLIGYSVLNQISSVPFQYFLVAMLVAKGHSQWYGGFALSVLFGSSIAGGFLGGMLSDRIGRKPTVVVLALTTVPFYYLYLYLENGSLWVLGILAIVGLVAMSTRTVSLAQAQELFPEARGTISGILLAIGFVMLSVAAFGFGALSDWIGIETAFYIVAISPLLALPFLKLVPNPGDPLE